MDRQQRRLKIIQVFAVCLFAFSNKTKFWSLIFSNIDFLFEDALIYGVIGGVVALVIIVTVIVVVVMLMRRRKAEHGIYICDIYFKNTRFSFLIKILCTSNDKHQKRRRMLLPQRAITDRWRTFTTTTNAATLRWSTWKRNVTTSTSTATLHWAATTMHRKQMRIMVFYQQAATVFCQSTMVMDRSWRDLIENTSCFVEFFIVRSSCRAPCMFCVAIVFLLQNCFKILFLK